MKNILKSWKTTLIGLVAIGALIYNAYTTGGFSVTDFLLLITGAGFLASKDGNQTHSDKNTVGGTLPPTPPPPPPK